MNYSTYAALREGRLAVAPRAFRPVANEDGVYIR